ncbi:rRNA maturation RNase YbeY [Patescibacteria group bacterium]|nr:rRNA maturation RNase YbeY [Patescibacteria group bacterium]MBU1868524.1 rRNA maturation RNase YbeY [Patescibacteria group bacterium]
MDSFPIEKINKAAKIRANVVLVNKVEMKRLNKQFLGKNEVTDVLSFPAEEDVEKGGLFLGEIVVNKDQVEKQAREWNVGVEEEIARVIAHGALHLLGYRDETSEDREVMEKAQERIVKKLKINS